MLFSNNEVLGMVRGSGENPVYQITDAVRDLSGNLVQIIGADGTITHTEYDALGRAKIQKQAYQTVDESTTQTIYNDYGGVWKTIANDGLTTEVLYDPAGNQTVRKLVTGVAALDQTTQFTYTIKGEPKKTIANDGTVTERFYSLCCGSSAGTRNALGHGSYSNSDHAGRVVHSVTVKGFDTQFGSLNPDTASTFSESTTRYRDDGKVTFRTRWTSDPGPIDVDNPQIAGVGGVAANLGLTTQYVYDKYLYDGIGLDAAAGQTIERIHTGGVNTINISAALAKIAETEANGGIEAVFSQHRNGTATVVISPDEKTMSVSISNGAGQSIMSATMSGPAASTPNQLIDWTCQRHGLPYSLAGYTAVVESRSIDADKNITRSFSNGMGESVGSMDQLGKMNRNIFDVAGNLVRTIDPLNHEMVYTYDNLGRRKMSLNELNETTSVTYDAGGRVETSTDARGGVTTNTYDELGRLTNVNDRLGKDTIRVYKPDSNLLHLITDAEGRSTLYDYDVLGRRNMVTLADNSETESFYDEAGRVYKVEMASGITRNSIYAPYSGELDKIEYRNAAGALVGTDDFSYDEYLRRNGSVSRYGVTRALAYTDRGQLDTDTTTYGGQSYLVDYGYNDRGQLMEITYPSGRVASYTFDERNLLDTISWDGSQIEDRTHNDLGLLTNVDRPHVDEVRGYDALNRVDSIANTNVGDASYTYDANGNKKSESWTGVMSAWNFTTEKAGAVHPTGYDAEDRFRNFVQTTQNKDLYLDRSDIGNISNFKLNGTDSIRGYSNTHELDSVGGVAQVCDADGNLTNSHTGIDLGWDEAGLLKQTVVDATDTAGIEGTNEYGYDSSQKRVWKKITRNGSIAEHTVYIYAGPNCIAEYSSGTAASSPDQEYVYAQSIDSLLMIVRNAGSQKLTVTRNQQWSVAALTDYANGTVLERYTYDALGTRAILAADGATVRASSDYGNPYGYTSRRHDKESGLMYFRARFYDSSTGEFCSKDPLEFVDGMSLFRGYFVHTSVDSTGLYHEGQQINNGGTQHKLSCSCRYRFTRRTIDTEIDCGGDYGDCCKAVCGRAALAPNGRAFIPGVWTGELEVIGPSITIDVYGIDWGVKWKDESSAKEKLSLALGNVNQIWGPSKIQFNLAGFQPAKRKCESLLVTEEHLLPIYAEIRELSREININLVNGIYGGDGFSYGSIVLGKSGLDLSAAGTKRNTLAHELGHYLHLDHTNSRGDLMYDPPGNVTNNGIGVKLSVGEIQRARETALRIGRRQDNNQPPATRGAIPLKPDPRGPAIGD